MIGSGSILANGAPGGTQTQNDAGGGGGAGGSVLVWSLAGPVTTGTLSISVQGGAGGDSLLSGTPAHGGGGGGGGGVAYVSNASGVTFNAAGGPHGWTNCGGVPAAQCDTSVTPNRARHGASSGAAGVTGVSSSDPIGVNTGARCLPELTVTKSTSTPTRVSGLDTTATYTITVSNAPGRGTALGVNVVDDLPNPFTWDSSAPVTVSYSGGASGPGSPINSITSGPDPVTFGTAGGTPSNSFTIPGGGSVTISFTVNLNSAGVGTYQNPAVANFLDPTRTLATQVVSPGQLYATGGQTAGGSNYNSGSSTNEDVTIVAQADLSVEKSQREGTSGSFQTTPLTVVQGQVVQYQIVVTNNGPSAANSGTFTDAVPSNLTGLSVVSTSTSGGASGCTASFSGSTLNGTVATWPS
ncbi:MAG: hypothetical protein N3F11_01865, partial [Casimicrobiaceae bacterium]|nr:hypothetical protein [Casimicrobiaceae bacterium]